MKKYLLPALLVLALAVLAACGSDDESIVLRVGESLGAEGDFITAAGERFTALHPHVTIEFVNVEVGQANSQMAIDGPAGVGPDVFVAPHDQLGALQAGGLVLPVPAGRVNHVRNQVLGAAATGATFDGTLFGYPIATETYAIFYNRDLIATADIPTTFDGLVSWVANFNSTNPGMHGFLFEPGGAFFTILFTTMDGNRLFGPQGTDATSPNLNTPAAIRGMEFMRSLRPILDVPAGDLDGGFLDGAFAAGQAAMLLTGPWNIAPFTNAGLNFGTAAIPALPGETTPPASFGGVRTAFVSAFSENVEYAHMFAEFLTTNEIQQLRYDMTGALPSISMQMDDPVLDGLLRQMNYAFPMPSIPQMGSFWDAMSAASANIWDGLDVTSQMDMVQTTVLGG